MTFLEFCGAVRLQNDDPDKLAAEWVLYDSCFYRKLYNNGTLLPFNIGQYKDHVKQAHGVTEEQEAMIDKLYKRYENFTLVVGSRTTKTSGTDTTTIVESNT